MPLFTDLTLNYCIEGKLSPFHNFEKGAKPKIKIKYKVIFY